MRFLLTGGYGCIGSWIIRNLIDQGHSFCVLDIQEDLRRLRLVLNDDEIARVPFVAGDVTNLPALRKIIHEQQITHVIHLAGLQVPTCRADPFLGARVNILGTLAVFEAVRQAQPQVERLVYASSAAVIGPPEAYGQTGALPDDVPLVPSTHYGVFKHCNEENARIYFQDFGLSSVGLRPWAVYGVLCDLLRRATRPATGRRRRESVPSSGGGAVSGSEIVQPARRSRGHPHVPPFALFNRADC
jgi:UDP-glucose 4-epimerase